MCIRLHREGSAARGSNIADECGPVKVTRFRTKSEFMSLPFHESRRNCVIFHNNRDERALFVSRSALVLAVDVYGRGSSC